MTTNRAWIRLPSGAHLDLINPTPNDWSDSDLATRLSRTYRWSGESSWHHPLSVAQHSLTVLALRQLWSGNSLTPADALNELLHDAEEGFLGFDCISPLKTVLGAPFKAVSDRLISAINTRYSLPCWTPTNHALHKRADLIAAASEAVHCVGWAQEEVRNVLLITHPILENDPLVTIYGGTPWEPWPSDVAATRFHIALETLLENVVAQSLHQPIVDESLDVMCP